MYRYIKMSDTSGSVEEAAYKAAEKAKIELESMYPVEIEIYPNEDGNIVLSAVAKSSDFREDEAGTTIPYHFLSGMPESDMVDEMVGSVEATMEYAMGYSF